MVVLNNSDINQVTVDCSYCELTKLFNVLFILSIIRRPIIVNGIRNLWYNKFCVQLILRIYSCKTKTNLQAPASQKSSILPEY